MRKSVQSRKPWPRRLTYPLWGLLLAAAAPAGLLVVQSVMAGHRPTLEWLADELSARAPAYLYVTLSTAAAFLVLGWILGREQDLLEACSTTDALTGLANRRHLDAQLADELARSARYGTPSALLLIDLDDLKAINDRHGHAAGDAALLAVADALRRSCRKTDLAARYGGDEFLVLATSSTAREARVLGERVRARLREATAQRRLSITVSIGVADVATAGSLGAESLYAAADSALYQAKSCGRDRVVLAVVPVSTVEITAQEKGSDGHHQAYPCAR